MLTIFLLIVAFLVFLTVFTAVRIVNQYEKGIVLRLGKYKATADAGIVIVMPYIESMIKVDMRERVINVDPQKVITKDNVSVIVDAVIYYKVVDPVKAEFEVEDFALAATTLAQTNLRNLVGDKSLDEALVARDSINADLREVLDDVTHNWGVKVTRVELQKIDPPEDITHAMSQQMKAEREKRAAILQSEGVKQSDILEAEGKKQKAILEAEGDAKARILRANAEAESVRVVAESAEKYFKERAQAFKQLEVSREVLSQGTKWVIPPNQDLLSVLNLGDSPVVPVPKKKST